MTNNKEQVYLYWGENDFAIAEAVKQLRQSILDPNWESFNYDQIPPDKPDGAIEALNQVMTPPFGMGKRLVWLVDTTICQECPEQLYSELERTLPQIPPSSVLVLTTRNKPDSRLKSTKLLQKYATFTEFSLIPPWKTDELVKQVESYAKTLNIKLTPLAVTLLAESVGNDTRQLKNELEKLSLLVGNPTQPINETQVAALVTCNMQNSLQLAGAILKGDTPKALALVTELVNKNEHGLRIAATLIGQFRTWLWVKLMVSEGEKDQKAIATAAEVPNPKRIYFFSKEVQSISLGKLTSTLEVLLDLEVSLKRGADSLSTLQTKVIQLCQICQA